MTRRIRVGVQLPEVEREVRWPELVDMAHAIDDLGFDGVWVGEHLLYRWADRPARGPWEAWTLMAALAAATSRATIGPLVACTSFHNPALLAKQAATIDEIAGGRFVLGLGAGWNETEFRAFGFPFDQRVDRFEEAFTIIRTLLQEGSVDFDGRFYQARDCELLPRAAAGRPAAPDRIERDRGCSGSRCRTPTRGTPGTPIPTTARPAWLRFVRSSTPRVATSAAILPRSAERWRSRSGCRAVAAGRWATRRRPTGSGRSKGRPSAWPMSSEPTLRRASTRSRRSSIRSTGRRSSALPPSCRCSRVAARDSGPDEVAAVLPSGSDCVRSAC